MSDKKRRAARYHLYSNMASNQCWHNNPLNLCSLSSFPSIFQFLFHLTVTRANTVKQAWWLRWTFLKGTKATIFLHDGTLTNACSFLGGSEICLLSQFSVPCCNRNLDGEYRSRTYHSTVHKFTTLQWQDGLLVGQVLQEDEQDPHDQKSNENETANSSENSHRQPRADISAKHADHQRWDTKTKTTRAVMARADTMT